ncbi:hypothetical protein ACFQZZ_29705 [Nocardia sp. GCM10030253]|uniref:hypothetical protein n=1 Tax=Nocardia sp. GCM10030253 TaxID=3273404 RepID=UPI003636DDEE
MTKHVRTGDATPETVRTAAVSVPSDLEFRAIKFDDLIQDRPRDQNQKRPGQHLIERGR